MLGRHRAIQMGIFLVLIVTLLMPGAALAQGTVVRVDPASSSMSSGQTAAVSIKVDNVSNLAAFEVHLSFNPAVLEVAQLANGGFIVADFTAQNTFDNAAGTIDYAIAQMNRPAASGSGTLLVVTFRAKAAGTSSIAYRGVAAAPTGVILADANGMAIPASLAPGTVTVGGGNVTPPPGATTPPPVVTTPPPVATTPPPGATTPPPVATTPPPTYNIIAYWTVQPGQTLYCIGRYYKVSPWAIAAVNYIPWPYWVYPGQVLAIPNVTWYNIPPGPVCYPGVPNVTPTPPPNVTPTLPPPVTPTPPKPTCRYYHYVLWGQTLSGIAWYYGTTIQAIMYANPSITNPNLIYAGSTLCIP